MQSIEEVIKGRRSIKLFNGGAVDKKIIQEMIQIGTWAPNHGNRAPWRFVVAVEEGYEQLIEVIKEYAVPQWKTMTEEMVQRQLMKFTAAAAAIFVLVPEDVRQKERLEDYAAASALVQNMMLYAWDKEVGTCWKTPGFLDHPDFRKALGATAGERIMCMLQVGQFDRVPVVKDRPSAELVTTYFGQKA